MATLKLLFFASHGGSNMQAIIDAIREGRLDARACAVISNNSGSGAIERAMNEGIPHFHISVKTHPNPRDLDEAIMDIIDRYRIDTICLAGYMKKLSPEIIRYVNGRVLNIHPALLPKFGGHEMYGIKVHEAVLASGETVSGASIHLVDEVYDHGKILAQREVPVMPGDTADTLATRVLEVEHVIYAETLQKIAMGEIVI